MVTLPKTGTSNYFGIDSFLPPLWSLKLLSPSMFWMNFLLRPWGASCQLQAFIRSSEELLTMPFLMSCQYIWIWSIKGNKKNNVIRITIGNWWEFLEFEEISLIKKGLVLVMTLNRFLEKGTWQFSVQLVLNLGSIYLRSEKKCVICQC